MKKKYTSKYTDNEVTGAQFLAEFVCERIAVRDKKVLIYKFWNSPEWNKVFLRQLAEANKLLKEVDIVSILAFLRSKKGQNIYSLGLKKTIIDGSKQYIRLTSAVTNMKTEEQLTENDVLYEEYVIDKETYDERYDKRRNLWEMLQ